MNRPLLSLMVVAGLSWADYGGAQESEEKKTPFELKVILNDHHKRLDDGVSRLSQMTVEKLEKLQVEYAEAGRSDDILAVAAVIKELKTEIAAIRKRQDERRAFTSSRPRKVNEVRDELTRVKWLRVGKQPGVPKTLYTLKPDGSVEGFFLDAGGNPVRKSGWVAWELKGKTLRVGPEAGGGENFTYDPGKESFIGTTSDLFKQKPE